LLSGRHNGKEYQFSCFTHPDLKYVYLNILHLLLILLQTAKTSRFAPETILNRKKLTPRSSRYEATFGAEVGTGGKISGPDEKFVLQAIQEFGPTLIKLGFPVWRIQADALSRTEYAGDLVGAAVSGKENIALQKPLSPKKDA
jgi:hypothetical protein